MFNLKNGYLAIENATGNPLCSIEDLEAIEIDCKNEVKMASKVAWTEFLNPIKESLNECALHLKNIAGKSSKKSEILKIINDLEKVREPIKKDVFSSFRKTMLITRGENFDEKLAAMNWFKTKKDSEFDNYSSNLYIETNLSSLKVKPSQAIFSDQKVDGRVILKNNFQKLFSQYPELVTFGEDTGIIGGVNQVMEGMQEEFGKLRVFDTGIRETTIIGQGIGMALRGLKPIAEIQYLDYLLYCIQIMSDDLATLSYRTKGTQKCPLIVRTRGHRLEGVWHAGSPLGGIINFLRGIIVCVPRNMVKAAGFYNTLIKSDDPALVIECLNAYRVKEYEPTNYGEFTTPIGIPEIVEEGKDITVVSYGSTFNICLKQ